MSDHTKQPAVWVQDYHTRAQHGAHVRCCRDDTTDVRDDGGGHGMSEHTPGPLTLSSVEPDTVHLGVGNLLIGETYDEFASGVGMANARLLAAAYNSYAQHCTDPVAAAEEDLLGDCVEALRMAKGGMDWERFKELTNAILAQTKQPEPAK